MRILGIDAATMTGLALVGRDGGREQLLHVERVDVATSRISQVARRVCSMGPIDLAVVEEPFVSTITPNIATTIRLAEIMGRWREALEACGVRTETCKAVVWQREMLTGLISGRSERGARKAAAQRWVQAVLGRALTQDEADAACLAVWGIRRALVRRAA